MSNNLLACGIVLCGPPGLLLVWRSGYLMRFSTFLMFARIHLWLAQTGELQTNSTKIPFDLRLLQDKNLKVLVQNLAIDLLISPGYDLWIFSLMMSLRVTASAANLEIPSRSFSTAITCSLKSKRNKDSSFKYVFFSMFNFRASFAFSFCGTLAEELKSSSSRLG